MGVYLDESVISLSLFTPDLDFVRSGAGDLEELSRNVASLTVQNLGPGQSQVAIRGVSAGQIVRELRPGFEPGQRTGYFAP